MCQKEMGKTTKKILIQNFRSKLKFTTKVKQKLLWGFLGMLSQILANILG